MVISKFFYLTVETLLLNLLTYHFDSSVTLVYGPPITDCNAQMQH